MSTPLHRLLDARRGRGCRPGSTRDVLAACRVVERRDVERDDLVAAREQIADEIDAEEAGSAGDEDALHR